MTLEEVETRMAALQAELYTLRDEILRLKGFEVIPGIGVIGAFKDDPTYEEAARLGREWREQVNRESLEEMDREERAAAAAPRKRKAATKATAAKKPKPRKTG